jgi:hypothetical protein
MGRRAPDRAAQGIAVGVRGSSAGNATGRSRFHRTCAKCVARRSDRSCADERGNVWDRRFTPVGMRARCGFSVAPIGAYGFELASGSPATHARSDLDLLIRADALRAKRCARSTTACRSIERELGRRDRRRTRVRRQRRGVSRSARRRRRRRCEDPARPEDRRVSKQSDGFLGQRRARLLDELDTTPKPGLVDRNGSGAHADLSFLGCTRPRLRSSRVREARDG